MKKLQKTIIFLDIDGTLIMPNQKPNSALLPSVIKDMSHKGFLFGLNSNRSAHDVEAIYKYFKLNGPVILENGVFFQKNIKAKKVFLEKNPLAVNKLTARLVKLFMAKKKISGRFVFGDTVKLIKDSNLKKIPLIIMANRFRKYTGSIHVFRYGVRDLELIRKLGKFLADYFIQHKLNLDVEIPKSFSNFVFWPRNINKGIALQRIKKYYKNYNYIMIGDDLADLKTLKEIDYFYAVGNAQPEVKKIADYVAKEKYSRGVMEILKYIDKNYDKLKV
ncbi:MAG: HAD family hydrolase [Candidatus Parcubacteria bacterium]|nr:HAD family hydrolase [Candidatus Parcubacteria bacterium]